MASLQRPWTVVRHGALERHEDNLWSVEADVPGVPMALRRRMTVVRLGDGRLLLHSAIALDEPSMRELEAWGRPALLVVPNDFHRLDAHAYRARYPDLRVLCPAACDKRAREAVAVDGHYDALPVDPALRAEPLRGYQLGEAVFVVRSGGDRLTLVFGDAVTTQPHLPGLAGLAYRLLGSSGRPRVPRLLRLFGAKDRPALRAHLEALAALPGLSRVIVGHGPIVEDSPAELLRAVARTA